MLVARATPELCGLRNSVSLHPTLLWVLLCEAAWTSGCGHPQFSAVPLVTFDGEGYGVAAAEAEGGDAALQITALQLVEERDKHARAGRADRMA